MTTTTKLRPVLTQQGHDELSDRVRRIREELLPELRPALVEKERDERDVAEFERLMLEADELEAFLAESKVIVVKGETFDGRIDFGVRARIRLDDGSETWVRPVHPREAFLDDERISVESPLARALLGAREGTTVWVGAPNGVWACEILEVQES